MSGVRNLRAMFEQKGDSNLPDRGRSPGPGGFGTPSPSASPRPLSKVRTSFVAVEKDGRIGLKREPSGDSVSVSSRRLSNDTDATTPQPLSERTDVFADNMATNATSFKTNLAHEPIPESPRQDTPAKFSPKKTFKTTVHLEPNANPDKVTDEEEPRTKMLPGNPTESSATRLGGTVLNGGISDALNGKPLTTTTAKAPSPSTSTTKPTSKTAAPVSTAKTATRAPRSPLTAKPPSVKEPTKPSSSAVNSSANPKKATATKTAASKPAPIDLPPSGTGFVKPKPKSPTRPVKLPPSLTTHTAASAQKFGNSSAAPAPRQSLSRASGNAQHLSVNPTMHRSPSRNSVSTTATTKTLRHKPSNANVGRSRPSLGLPPKPPAKDPPAAKKENHVDESFLTRMMRPTQSSAHKTAEKAPVTPPRKQNAPIKKSDMKDVERSAKKVATKIQASSTKAKTAKDNIKPVVTEKPTAKEIAPAVAQAETAEAAIEDAKLSTDTAEAPLVEEQKDEAEPSAKDVAAIVAQEETAEDIIETAKTSADTAITADVPVVDESEGIPVAEPIKSLKAEVSSSKGTDELEPTVSIPVISEDPVKVEDVEDVEDLVQEGYEHTPQPESTEPTVEVAQSEDITETNDPVAISTKEPEADVEETVDDPAKPAESMSDAKEIVSEETKSESPKSSNTPLDGVADGHTTEGQVAEATTGDAVTAAL